MYYGCEGYLFKVHNGQSWGLLEATHLYQSFDLGSGFGEISVHETGIKTLSFGLLDRIDFKYSSIEKLESSNRLLKCSINNKYGIVDAKGKQILSFIYDEIVYEQRGLCKVYNNHKVGVYAVCNNSIRCLVSCDYDDVLLDFRTGFHLVQNNGKWGVPNILNCEYDKIEVVNDTYLIVWINGKCGLCQRDGKMLSEIKYDEIAYMDHISPSRIYPFYPFKVKCISMWGMVSPHSYIECEYNDIIYDKETDMILFVQDIISNEMSSRDFKTRYIQCRAQRANPSQVGITERWKFEL